MLGCSTGEQAIFLGISLAVGIIVGFALGAFITYVETNKK